MSSSDVAMSRMQIGGEVPLLATEITDQCIYTGLFGSIDSARMAMITEKMIDLAEDKEISVAIVDLSNVEAIDSSVAGYMVRLGKTLDLVGVTAIFCGISGSLASTMVAAGLGLEEFLTTRNMKEALRVSFEITGYRLEQVAKGISSAQAQKAVK
ncbi:MAG: STAS domain-containing protein [Candidatus Thiodiazotropha taylori]|nr:STAS domain-containing protein [Candidatus Thiodiazotropha taylori]